MNHPKIKHAIAGENVGSNIPWSPAAELHLRRRITGHWTVMWIFLIFAAVEVIRLLIQSRTDWLSFLPFCVLLGGAIANLFLLGQCRDRLGEEMRRLPNGDWFPGSGMLANKPRSTANLTGYFEHREKDDWFICAGWRDGKLCRIRYFWKDAEWIPNHDPDQRADGTFPDIDPGGGRWVILCPCGVGHYKLRG
jgi:hypothetical protein